VLLPGLDGTGNLFDRLERAAPRIHSMRRIALPPDRILSYDELAQWVLPLLPPPPICLIGESFSGPLALRLTRHVEPVAVVLCASFLRAPTLSRLSAVPLSFLLRATPPRFVVSALMSGGDTELADDLIHAIASVEKHVLTARLRTVLKVDVTTDLAAFRGPVLYLRSTRDRLVGGGQADLVRQTRPDARIIEVDGPHLFLQARPHECWDHMAPFIASKQMS